MKVKEESEKAGLKLNIQKNLRSWHRILSLNGYLPFPNNGNSDRLYVFGLQKSLQMVSAAMKFKDSLLIGRIAMTNLDRMLKSKDITLPTKVHIVKTMIFPIVMYGCELDHKES